MGLIIALQCKLKACTFLEKYLQLFQKIIEIGVQKQADESMAISENVM